MGKYDFAVNLLNEFPDSEAAIIIEYDHCKFAFEISLLVDTYQMLLEVVPGHIEDPWDCLVADERSWHWRNDLSSPIRCEIKKKYSRTFGQEGQLDIGKGQ